MNIYHPDYKYRKVQVIKENNTHKNKIDLDKQSGRNIIINGSRWKWKIIGSNVRATNVFGKVYNIECYKLAGYSSYSTYERDKYDNVQRTSITPGLVSKWLTRII